MLTYSSSYFPTEITPPNNQKTRAKNQGEPARICGRGERRSYWSTTSLICSQFWKGRGGRLKEHWWTRGRWSWGTSGRKYVDEKERKKNNYSIKCPNRRFGVWHERPIDNSKWAEKWLGPNCLFWFGLRISAYTRVYTPHQPYLVTCRLALSSEVRTTPRNKIQKMLLDK